MYDMAPVHSQTLAISDDDIGRCNLGRRRNGDRDAETWTLDATYDVDSVTMRMLGRMRMMRVQWRLVVVVGAMKAVIIVMASTVGAGSHHSDVTVTSPAWCF